MRSLQSPTILLALERENGAIIHAADLLGVDPQVLRLRAYRKSKIKQAVAHYHQRRVENAAKVIDHHLAKNCQRAAEFVLTHRKEAREDGWIDRQEVDVTVTSIADRLTEPRQRREKQRKLLRTNELAVSADMEQQP